MDDAEFDALLPDQLARRSRTHFTPAAVARRAVELLVVTPGAWVLDVGAGVGKFCIVGAIAAPDATFIGIERRRPLVQVATAVARRLALPNVDFLHGDAVDVDWSRFHAFYLYNPFVEHVRERSPVFDRSIELDPGYYPFYVDFVRARLRAAPVGTRVVTYHGFGGTPSGYDIVSVDLIGTGELALWVKTRAPRTRVRRSP